MPVYGVLVCPVWEGVLYILLDIIIFVDLYNFNILRVKLIYSRTPLILINWDGEPSGYAENPENWIFL